VPEATRIIERTFVERQTEPLPVTPSIHIEVPATPPPAAPPSIVVNAPERSKDEQNVRGEDAPTDDKASSEKERSSAPETDVSPVVEKPAQEQKQFEPVNKNSSPEEQKPYKNSSEPEQNFVPPTNEKNSETIPGSGKNNSGLELFLPLEPASQASVPAYKKKGKVGRQRKYDELGIDDVEPVREVILLMHHTGQGWPGMSKDMRNYYEYWYFTKPNKRKDGKDYERHVKCWERKERWTAATPV
jgi:hypothetical protein